LAAEQEEGARILDGDQEWAKIQGQIEEVLKPKLQKIIERISARSELAGSELAVPFTPYVGPSYARAPTKILFVGEAHRPGRQS
jgi:hypothetical protein